MLKKPRAAKVKPWARWDRKCCLRAVFVVAGAVHLFHLGQLSNRLAVDNVQQSSKIDDTVTLPITENNDDESNRLAVENVQQSSKIDDTLTSPIIENNGDGVFGTSACVAMLLANTKKDMHNAPLAIKSLNDRVKGGPRGPLLLFHEGNLRRGHMEALANATARGRRVAFPLVNFSDFPDGFDPRRETPRGFVKRTKWGYHQMIRFWIAHIWTHDALREHGCRTVMRMDADSCFVEDVDDRLPGLESERHVYRANKFQVTKDRYVEGLMDLTAKFILERRIKPANRLMLARATSASEGGFFPMYYNNFEVSRVDFFLRPDVMEYQRAVAEEEPFGVFRRRWGDASVRYLTLALFAGEDEVDQRPPPAYGHSYKECPGVRRISHKKIWKPSNSPRVIPRVYSPLGETM